MVIDAHSKWPEIFVMENTLAEDSVSTLHWRGQFNFKNCTIYLKWSDYPKCFNWTKCITGLIRSTASTAQSSFQPVKCSNLRKQLNCIRFITSLISSTAETAKVASNDLTGYIVKLARTFNFKNCTSHLNLLK